MRSQSDMGRHLRTSAACGGGPSRIHADGTVGRLSPQPAAGATCGLLRGRVSLRGDLTFPQVEGLDAWGIALASPTPAARLRDNPARLARGEGGAHMSARPQKVGMASLVLHFDTDSNAYICMLQRNPYVAEGLWGPAWDHARGTSRQIACNLAVGTASKVDCKTLCSPHLLRAQRERLAPCINKLK